MANKNTPKRNEFIVTAGAAIALYGLSVLKKAFTHKSKNNKKSGENNGAKTI